MSTRPSTSPSTPGWPMMERSAIATVLGLPGYAAILIALGFTALGVFIDLERINGLGTVFKACYFVGCVLSVCWVKRRALFGPLVQPPLLLAVAVPGVVLLAGGAEARAGAAARMLAIGTPLLNGFPTMAVTTAFVLAIGIGRYLVQRPPVRSEPVARERTRPTPPAQRSAPAPPSGPAAPARSGPGKASAQPEPATLGRDTSDDPTAVLPPAADGGDAPKSGRPEPRPEGQGRPNGRERPPANRT